MKSPSSSVQDAPPKMQQGSVLTGLSNCACVITSAVEGMCPVRCKGVISAAGLSRSLNLKYRTGHNYRRIGNLRLVTTICTVYWRVMTVVITVSRKYLYGIIYFFDNNYGR